MRFSALAFVALLALPTALGQGLDIPAGIINGIGNALGIAAAPGKPSTPISIDAKLD